ncbi:hypothetical protein BDW02DRAFT_595129 [Decorospora gaudefroyi]|uniref:Uncharacterized protein n=1 Tax=Decorospora gaudefroyi TaxID=184978 RepID=A0A6A5KSE7_9PLEO|nr:hypothetical protein BDW02DRAFT_595129 [Decorospora gaudefroyi]
MKLAINATLGAVTWVTYLLNSFLGATNDVAWFFSDAEVSHLLLAHVNCSFPTPRCVRDAKAAGVALAKAHDDTYWAKVGEEAAQAEQIRLKKQAYDGSVADAFTKAKKYDLLLQNPPNAQSFKTSTPTSPTTTSSSAKSPQRPRSCEMPIDDTSPLVKRPS